MHLKNQRSVVCPYCQTESRLVDSSVIYGKSYGMIYLCQSCEAYVGVHKGTDIPLGTLANRSTREARKAAHLAFDTLWKQRFFFSRKEAYSWLAKQFNVKEIHIGEADVTMCTKIIDVSLDYFSKNQRLSVLGESLLTDI